MEQPNQIKKVKKKRNSLDKVDYAHRLIYRTILGNVKIQREARLSKVELTEELVHLICEHSRVCISDWIGEKVRGIKVPYIGRFVIKPYREIYEDKINNLLRRGVITREEAKVIQDEISKEIIADLTRKKQFYKNKPHGGKKITYKRFKVRFIKDTASSTKECKEGTDS